MKIRVVPLERMDYRRAPEYRASIGATMIGIPQAEYRRHVEAGEKWCGHHGWHPRTTEFFYARSTTVDGLDSVCKAIVRERSRRGMARLRQADRARRQEAS